MFDNIYTFYDDAEYVITEFNADKVIKLLKKRIANGEVSAPNYGFLANAYFIKNDNVNALKYALKSKKLDENYFYADFILTIIYIDEDNPCKAEKYLVQMLEKCPDDYYFAYFAASSLYYLKQELDIVKKYSDKLLQTNIKTPDCSLMKALVCFYEQDYKNVLKYSFYSLKAFPNIDCTSFVLICISFFSLIFTPLKNPCFWQSLLTIFLPKDEKYYCRAEICMYDNPEKAMDLINKACEINQKPQYLQRKAEIFLFWEKYNEAIEIYKDILEKDSTYTQCYYMLSAAYKEIGDYKSCLEYANKSILNNINVESAYSLKAVCLRSLGKPEKAIECLKKLQKEFPESPNLNYYLAQLYADMLDYKNALIHINKQLLIEKDALNYDEKTCFLFRLERFDEAIEAAEKALEFGENGVVYYWLACCYEAKEEYSKALEYINKSILMGENDCWTFWHKSSIMGALGKNKEAEIAYKKAVELGFVESV